MKQKIYKDTSFQNKTVSNYLRDHLQEFIDGSLFEEEIANYKNNSFINSTEYLKLATWIISKKQEPTCLLANDTINEYIQTLKKISEHMPPNIVEELDKVLADLLRVV